MSENKFKTGDAVLLKSGGSPMTVRSHITGVQALKDGWPEFVSVDWLDTAGISHTQKFHPDQLEIASRMATYDGHGGFKTTWEFAPPKLAIEDNAEAA